MRYKVVCIRDRAVDAFSAPFYSQSVGSAIRSFTDEINRGDANNNMFRHPDDFDLYLLGEFDDATGMFHCKTPEQIAIGKDLKV